MSDRSMRAILRWSHTLIALALLGWVYTPLLHDPLATSAARFLLIPLLGLTGAAMWQQLGLARFSDRPD